MWGYDFFISYRWACGGVYAVSLAEQLRGRGYDCFLDRAEFAPSDDWKVEAARALRNTQRLVVIATRDAMLSSEAVAHEVKLYSTKKSARIVPIVFGERFSGDDRANIPTLAMISHYTLDIIEKPESLKEGPSKEVLDQLILTHRLLRRRSIRALTVLVAFIILAAASVVSVAFGIVAEVARAEENRQKQLAQSAESINRSDLLRETQGPRIEESLRLAKKAYQLSVDADAPSKEAERAVRQASRLIPKRLGEPWTPFTSAESLQIRSLDEQVTISRKSTAIADEPYTLVAQLDRIPGKWSVIRAFRGAEQGERIANQYGQVIQPSGGSRWVATRKNGHVLFWDLGVKNKQFELPFDHAPQAEDGEELLTYTADGAFALSRAQRGLVLWETSMSPPKKTPLSIKFDITAYAYAISPSGQWIASAQQNKFALVDVKQSTTRMTYSITRGGGHPESLGFIGGPSSREDHAVYVTWSANQIGQMAPGNHRNAPSHQAGLWNMAEVHIAAANTDAVREVRPNVMLVRKDRFDLSFAGDDSRLMAVLDAQNPLQLLDTESEISFTLGTTAGPAIKCQFSPRAKELLAVHLDGTARLWNLTTREEILRFAADGAIVDAAFLLKTTETPFPPQQVSGVVTQDGRGRIQAWSVDSLDSP